MKVHILSTKYYGTREIIDRYPILRDYNFEVIGEPRRSWPYITLKDLDDLLKLTAGLDKQVILWYDFDQGAYFLEIYDDYRE